MFPASSSKPTTSSSNNMMIITIKCCWGWCWEEQGPLSCMRTSPTISWGWQLEWSTDSLRGRSNSPAGQVMQCATAGIASTMATMEDANPHKQMFGWRQGQSCGLRWSWGWGWRRSAWEATSSPAQRHPERAPSAVRPLFPNGQQRRECALEDWMIG